MSKPNTTRWIGIGLLGVPIYGVLTFWTSLDPQPDPGTQLEAWARFVTTNEYLLEHLFGSLLGMILVIFGTFALEAAPIGGQLLAHGISGRDCIAFCLLLDTYDTRLLAQALRRPPCKKPRRRDGVVGYGHHRLG